MTSDWLFSPIVISSESEKSFPLTENRICKKASNEKFESRDEGYGLGIGDQE